MSITSPNDILNFSDWGRMKAKILGAIFEKLDDESLFNSMCVNRYWKAVGIYHCNHNRKWQHLVEISRNNEYSIVREKSDLRIKNLVLNALQWYNVKYATVRLCHRYGFEDVKNICIYNDDLIVVSNHGVEYYNLNIRLLMKTVNSSCIQYIETASIIAEVTPLKGRRAGYYILSVTNKLHNINCKCFKPLTKTFIDIFLWKVIGKHIYIMDSTKNLRWFRISKCTWEEKTTILPPYHNQNLVLGWQIKKKHIYILNKDFTISHVDWNGYEHGIVHQFYSSAYYLDPKPYMFNTYSAIYAVPREENFKIDVKEDGKELFVACPEFTCATEHGHMVLVGYENGKVQIFRTADLFKKSETPVLQFNLQSFTKSLTNKIIALDVHEYNDCLSVLVATKFNVYHFILSEN